MTMAKKKQQLPKAPLRKVFGTFCIEPMGGNLIVACLSDGKDIHKELNKKRNKNISDWVREHVKEFPMPDGDGAIVYSTETNRPIILFIKNKERNWSFYETLLHELHHLVFHCSMYYGFEKEAEFQAYLIESTFRRLRKIL